MTVIASGQIAGCLHACPPIKWYFLLAANSENLSVNASFWICASSYITVLLMNIIRARDKTWRRSDRLDRDPQIFCILCKTRLGCHVIICLMDQWRQYLHPWNTAYQSTQPHSLQGCSVLRWCIFRQKSIFSLFASRVSGKPLRWEVPPPHLGPSNHKVIPFK